MKYKIGLYLTILISAGIYCPSVFAYTGIIYNQPLHDISGNGISIVQSTPNNVFYTATTTSQGWLSAINFYNDGVYNNPANFTFRVKILDFASTTVYGISSNVTVTRIGGNTGTTTVPFSVPFFLNAGTRYKALFEYVSGTGDLFGFCPVAASCLNNNSLNNISMEWDADLPSNGNVYPATPVNSLSQKQNPINFSGTYTNNSTYNEIVIALNYNGLNNDGAGGYSQPLIIPIPALNGTNLNYSKNFNLTAGWYTWNAYLYDSINNFQSATSSTYILQLQNSQQAVATSTPYGLTITMATGSIQLPVLQGIATSTCTGDLITDFGCNFKNGLIIFTNALIVPDTSSLGYISSAFSKFQSVFPFSVFFTFQTYSQANLSLPQQGQTLTIPQLGTFTPQIDLLSSTTLSNFFGTAATDDYFNFWQNVIWISTFVGMVYVII